MRKIKYIYNYGIKISEKINEEEFNNITIIKKILDKEGRVNNYTIIVPQNFKENLFINVYRSEKDDFKEENYIMTLELKLKEHLLKREIRPKISINFGTYLEFNVIDDITKESIDIIYHNEFEA